MGGRTVPLVLQAGRRNDMPAMTNDAGLVLPEGIHADTQSQG
jgi:hypothetical protein